MTTQKLTEAAKGVYIIAATPFTDDGALDLQSVDTLTDFYLGCGLTRGRLFGAFGGKAVDMESGAVAQVAEAFGAPWLIIRALSDLAGEDSQLDFQVFAAQAAKTAAAAVLKALPLFDAAALS